MKFDVTLAPRTLAEVPALARQAEAVGADGLWFAETMHDPFLALALAAEHTTRIELGTAIAVAFARSPTVVAHTAWDLAQFSGGRFRLGLGTQVRAHIERRFGMPWAAPVPRLREYVQAVRAVWGAWQTDERLNYRGEHYKLTLMTPFFSPGPAQHAGAPIYLAGVNARLVRLAGELADGFHVHSLHTVRYLREVIRPAIAEGAARAGRDTGAVQLASMVFAAVGESEAERAAERERLREQIAFYASTPSYRGVLALHGWEAAGEALSALAARGRWAEMPAQVTDEMLAAFIVEGSWAEVGPRLEERYTGLLDRVGLYRPFTGAWIDRWEQLVKGIRANQKENPI